MAWGLLLETVHGLQVIGMGVPIALEQHARCGSDASRRLAARWLALRLRLGDPGEAMRCLAFEARDPADRLAAESLMICLQRPTADHESALRAAVEHLQSARQRPHSACLALVLVALASGESDAQAVARAAAAYGDRTARAARALLNKAERGPIPGAQAIRNALRDTRGQRQRGLALALPAAATTVVALTIGTLGVVMPGSVELGLAGW